MALTEKEVLDLFKNAGGLITSGHFVYTSGKHGSVYLNKDALYVNPNVTSQLCRSISEKFAHEPIETVVGPVIGGVLLSQWVAYHLTEIKKQPVNSVYAEKNPAGGFVFNRGYDQHVRGKNILVVEDILNTGGSIRDVLIAVEKTGGRILGLGALANRGGVQPKDLGNANLKMISLLNIQFDAWDPQQCELCQKKIPIHLGLGKGKTN